MFNWVSGEPHEQATALKALVTELLDAIVVEHAGPRAQVDVAGPSGDDQRTGLSRCTSCGSPHQVWIPDGDARITARFHPDFWGMDLHDASRSHVAHTSQILRKRTSELPSGTEITGLGFAGEHSEIDPPSVVDETDDEEID